MPRIHLVPRGLPPSILLFALALTLSVAGCGKGPDTAPEPAKGQPKTDTDPGKKPVSGEKDKPFVYTPPVLPPPGDPDFKTTALAYDAEFRTNEKAAIAKYKGKVIELTGVVLQIWSESLLGRQVSLDPNGSNWQIHCNFPGGVDAGVVVPGRTVRLKGQNSGYRSSGLDNCVLLDVGPDTAVRASAVDLAKEFAPDWNKTNDKYRSKGIVVTGEVTSTFKFGLGLCVVLKGEGDVVVRCYTVDGPEKLEKLFPVGRTVTIAGLYSPGDSSPKHFGMASCHLVETNPTNP